MSEGNEDLENGTVEKGKVQFRTAILTYPSTFMDQLNVDMILSFLKEKLPGITIVVAKEMADKKHRRDHFHCYLDSKRQLRFSITSYLNIPLQRTICCWIKEDGEREYTNKPKTEDEMAELHSSMKEKGYIEMKELKEGHPNLVVKSNRYGSKYQMLKYVIKQEIFNGNNKVQEWNKEVVMLEDQEDRLFEKIECAKENGLLKEERVSILGELKSMAKDELRKFKKRLKKMDVTTKEYDEFSEFLRQAALDERTDKNQVYREILDNPKYWKIYIKNVVNFEKLIEKFMKPRPIVPKIDYQKYHIYYLPRKLYDYVKWLDDWIMKWETGKPLDNRPKGLVVISPSRFGKTDLMLAFGSCSYIPNIWNMDQWNSAAAFTIFDDMDPGNDDKGLNFTWYKGFFGAQRAIDITDKYRPKRTVNNGKPLIWLSNKPLDEVFKGRGDIDYIDKNCDIVYLDKPLFEQSPDWIEGHNDYIKFDTHDTWWYKNKIVPELERKDEEEPLDIRKRRLSLSEEKFEQDKGRLAKKPRVENKNNTTDHE